MCMPSAASALSSAVSSAWAKGGQRGGVKQGVGRLMLRFSACTAPAALAHREQNPVAVPGQHLAVLAQR